MSAATKVILAITDRTYDGDSIADLRTLRICKTKDEVRQYKSLVKEYISTRNYQNEVYTQEIPAPAEDDKYLVIPVNYLHRCDGYEDTYDVNIHEAYFVKSRNDVFRDTEGMDEFRVNFSHMLIIEKSTFEWEFGADALEQFPEMMNTKKVKKTAIKLAAQITGW
jgi:hypothetical protein